MIEIYNEGVTHSVTQPQICIDGTWKDVASEEANIDGVWKNVFSRDYYVIRLYRYEELVQTLQCQKGSSISLVTVDTIEEDDVAHYGWTATAGATTRDYTTTKSITPTSDMDLHAVFQCVKTTIGTASINVNQRGGTDAVRDTVQIVSDGTIKIKGYIETYYSSGGYSFPQNLTLATSYTSTGCFVGINTSSSSIAGLTYISGTVNSSFNLTVEKSVTAGQYVHIQVYAGSNGSDTYYKSIRVEYPGYIDETFYRSSLQDATINFYAYGELIDTVTTPLSTTIYFPSADNVDDDEFAGWSLSEFIDSTTSPSYKSGGSYKVTNLNTNFYAVFNYDSTVEASSATTSKTLSSTVQDIVFDITAYPNTNWEAYKWTQTPTQKFQANEENTGANYWVTYTTTRGLMGSGTTDDTGQIYTIFEDQSFNSQKYVLYTGFSGMGVEANMQSGEYYSSSYIQLNYYASKTVYKYRTTK